MDSETRKPTAAMLEEVMASVDREDGCADDILALLGEERAAIQAMDMESLMSLSRRKKELMERLTLLDTSLRDKVDNCLGRREPVFDPRQGKMIGGPRSMTVNLSALLPFSDETMRRRLVRGRDLLVSKRIHILQANELHKRLVEDSLGFVQQAVKMITGSIAEAGYGANGNTCRQANRPAFISRSI